MSPTLMCYSQLFISVSLSIITYGCFRRKVLESEKVEMTKKERLGSNSNSETQLAEVTAKSDRTEWEAPQSGQKTSTKLEVAKEPSQFPKSLSAESFEVRFKESDSPDGRKTDGDQKKDTITRAPADNVPQKPEGVTGAPTAPMLSKAQPVEEKKPKKHVFILEPLSDQQSEERKDSQDETVHDAPSLEKINISKKSEELESIRRNIMKKPKTSKNIPQQVKTISQDETQLYQLQKTMTSQRNGREEKLMLDKTPFPSSLL
ncbi:hypothetical protein RB195_020412 [Necator americanus]